MKAKKLKKLIKEIRLNKEEFGGSGVSGVAGIGIVVGGQQDQAEPGVHPKDQPSNKRRKPDFPKTPKSPVMGFFKRKTPQK